MRSTYQAAFGAKEMPENETLVASAMVFQLSDYDSPQEFLAQIKKGRVENEPDTGRFEIIRNQEKLYEARAETCVVYQSASNDFGAQAERAGQHTLLESYGMACAHPDRPSIGISVELSRKAPAGTEFPEFETMASRLLESVEFIAF